MTTAYATNLEVQNAIQLTAPSDTDNAVITAVVLAASNAIDRFCCRLDGFIAPVTATARTYAGSGKPYQLIDECASVTTVAVKDAVTDTAYVAWVVNTDYIPFTGDPEFPDFNHTPYTGLMIAPNSAYSIFISGTYTTGRGGFARDYSIVSRGLPTVQVTAKWGYATTVPEAVKEACIIQTARWFKRGQGAFSDALATGSLGDLQYRRVLDLDVRDLLTGARLVRPNIGKL
jgi:hypothetical protein